MQGRSVCVGKGAVRPLHLSKEVVSLLRSPVPCYYRTQVDGAIADSMRDLLFLIAHSIQTDLLSIRSTGFGSAEVSPGEQAVAQWFVDTKLGSRGVREKRRGGRQIGPLDRLVR